MDIKTCLGHIGWSCHQTQCFEERFCYVSLTDKVSKHPDSLEHIDNVEEDHYHAVLTDVEDQGGDHFQIPI